MAQTFAKRLFFLLVCLTLLTPFWVFKDMLFPFITSKAYYLRILVELTFPVYLYLLLGNKDYRPNLRNPLNIFVLVFVVLNILSAIFGVNPLKSMWGNFERMGGVFYIAHLTAYYFYIQLLGSMGQNYFRRFLIAVISLGALMACYGALVKLGVFTFLPDPSLPRVSATLGNPIFFASFLILPLFVTLYYLLQEQNRFIKSTLVIVAALELWCIFLSQTRGAVVGIAVGLFIAALFYILLTNKKEVRLVGGISVVVFLVLIGLAFSQHERFAQGSMLRRVFNLRDTNTEARLVQWKVALQGFKDKPLLGVGPENYYVISNGHYNPEIYKYDKSWFDKPHNYLLEILVTGGILGFMAYVGILLTVIWILFKSQRKELFSLMEFCLLLTGFTAYTLQNLFVFDTIPASLMFYVFLGFAAFLWKELREIPGRKKIYESGMDSMFVNFATIAACLCMAYVIYAGNIAGARIAKAVNYGYAYGSTNPQSKEYLQNIQIANSYFQQMRELPFNFDPMETSGKFSDYVVSNASFINEKNHELAKKSLSEAINFQESSISRVPNDPIAYQRLSNLYITQAKLLGSPIPDTAQRAIDKAMQLAPGRPEPILANAQLRIIQNNLPGAIAIIKDLVQEIPSHIEARMQLGLLYWYNGNVEEALVEANKALQEGYNPRSVQEIDWMAQAYVKQGDYAKAAVIYEQIVKIDPENLNGYWQLAQVYAKLGKKSEAIQIAKVISTYDPSRKSEIEAFITEISK